MATTLAVWKASERTSRKGCDKCSATDVYWATVGASVDSGGPFVLMSADSYMRGLAKGESVWRPENHVHACFDAKLRRLLGVDQPTPDAVPEPMPTVATPAPKPPVAAPVVAPIDDVAGALATLTRAFGGAKIDPEAIRAMVREELTSAVYPTHTVVVRDTVRHEVPGLTHESLADVIATLSTGEHVYLVGPPATGKSHMAEQAAEALGLPFRGSISVCASTMDSDLFGFVVPGTGAYHGTGLRDAFELGGIFLIDEIDKGHPGIISIINAITSNNVAGFPDGLVKRHPDFRLVVTANTAGLGPDRMAPGSQQLDAATLTRFSQITIRIDAALERALCLGALDDAKHVDSLLAYVGALRVNAESAKLPVHTLSPRATVACCRLMQAGMEWPKIQAMRLSCGLTAQDWTKISAGVKAMAA